MQISGVDYGPAVPSGVSVCPARCGEWGAGVVAVRTRSLLLPIAVHVGLDIPIYYAFACAT